MYVIRTAALCVTAALAMLYSAWAPASTLTTLHSFAGGADGNDPSALVYVGGLLYGTTWSGGGTGCYGHQGCGTIFSLDPATGIETVLYSFDGPRGRYPRGALAYNEGKIYGATYKGGAYAQGNVFQFDLRTGHLKVLHSFGNGTDGAYPGGGVIYQAGTLYGTALNGGTFGDGVIFAIDLSSGTETVLHSFNSDVDGDEPLSSLIYQAGSLYGTTPDGGANHLGTVFGLDLATGQLNLNYDFVSETDGYFIGAPVVYVSGSLYGVALYGGTSDDGTAFAINLASGNLSVLRSFTAKQGEHPGGGLLYRGVKLFGTTTQGGTSGDGTMYSLDPETGALHVIYSFSGADGALPNAGLIIHNDGFFGTTSAGGSAGLGTVFKLVP